MKRKKTLWLALGFAGIALAQTGVDNSTASGVFQMEGDATRTATICFLPLAGGGPAIATPGSYPPGSTPCPTVNPAGNAATWTLVNYGANTDDWSSFAFNPATGKFTDKAHSLFPPAFITDPRNSQQDNTFLGASSKDTQDITQWAWNPHGTQDKDDIEHAFAGAYKLANGNTAIFAGMDRFANAGDATAGFWFVQDSTFALCTGAGQSSTGPNAACKASGTFLGKHFDGDLLIVSDFSIGGAVSTINVFVWQGGTLVLSETRSPAPCDPTVGNSSLCGLVNNAFTQVLDRKGNPILQAVTVTTGGWSFGDKNGLTAFQTGEFLEIAVDLNAVFGNNIPCFSTFFAETRSSTSPTASLSDLTGPVSFPLCSMAITKVCTGSSIVGGNSVRYNFTGDVTNTGANTIFAATVVDTPPAACSAPTVTQPSAPNGILGGGSASYSGNMTCSAILGANDQNSVSATASSSNTGTPLNVGPATANWGDPTTGSCPPSINKGLTLTKACKSCLVAGTNDVSVQVSEAFKVCNTGNVTISNITVQDCRGTISGLPGSQTCSTGFVTIASNVTIAAGAACQTFSANYKPTSAAASYSDQAIASGTAALGGGTVFANGGTPAQASCPVCPINTDCATNPPVAP